MRYETDYLRNGVAVIHLNDGSGRVIFRMPDGSEVQTNWTQLAGIEQLARDLQHAYDALLARAQCEHSCRHLPIDLLARIDETLYRTNAAVQGTGDLFGNLDRPIAAYCPQRDSLPFSAKSRSSIRTSLSTGGVSSPS